MKYRALLRRSDFKVFPGVVTAIIILVFIFLPSVSFAGSISSISLAFSNEALINGPANVRNTPKGEVILTVNDGAPVDILSVNGSWYRIGVDVYFKKIDWADGKLRKDAVIYTEKGTVIHYEGMKQIGKALSNIDIDSVTEVSSDSPYYFATVEGYTYKGNIEQEKKPKDGVLTEDEQKEFERINNNPAIGVVEDVFNESEALEYLKLLVKGNEYTLKWYRENKYQSGFPPDTRLPYPYLLTEADRKAEYQDNIGSAMDDINFKTSKEGYKLAVKILKTKWDYPIAVDLAADKVKYAGDKSVIPLLKKIAKNYPDPDVRQTAANSLLYLGNNLFGAAKRGDFKTVKALLDSGANVNAKDTDGETALIEAAGNGHGEIVKILLNHGADANASFAIGWTALLLASEGGFDNIVEQLLSHGALINHQNKYGWTALIEAVENDQPDVVKILLSHDADVNLKDSDGQTALSHAYQKGDIDIVKMLLAYGSKVNAKDNDGQTALILASGEGHANVVRILLTHGAKVNTMGRFKRTALMAAAAGGYDNVVKILLAHGANINQKDKGGLTALYWAAYSGQDNVVKTLINHGAWIQKDNIGNEALFSAALNGYDDVVKTLLANGADVNAKDPDWDDQTALIEAANNDHDRVVETLLAHGADVNAIDNRGYTALIIAAEKNGHDKAIQTLLAHGARILAKSKSCFNAILTNIRYHHPALAAKLEKTGWVEGTEPHK